MKLTGTIILVYGLITMAGGVIGYVQADSLMSLIMGIAVGILLIADAFLLYRGKVSGIYIALLVSLGLGIFFGLRYSKSGAVMPAGMMTILSMIVLGFSVFALSSRKNGKSVS